MNGGGDGRRQLASAAPVGCPETKKPLTEERLQDDAKEQKRAFAALQTELARYRAGELAAAAERSSAGSLVLREVDADANTSGDISSRGWLQRLGRVAKAAGQ